MSSEKPKFNLNDPSTFTTSLTNFGKNYSYQTVIRYKDKRGIQREQSITVSSFDLLDQGAIDAAVLFYMDRNERYNYAGSYESITTEGALINKNLGEQL